MTNDIRILSVLRKYYEEKALSTNSQEDADIHDALLHAIKALEAQPTDKNCISREAVTNTISTHLYESFDDGVRKASCYGVLKRIEKQVDNLPSVHPERPKGKWIGSNGVNYTYPNSFTICSVCKCHSDKFYKYCPNCGADMKEDSE